MLCHVPNLCHHVSVFLYNFNSRFSLILHFLFMLIFTFVPQDVDAVVETAHGAGISKKAFKLRPVAVIKG